jgi:hypothetical protein
MRRSGWALSGLSCSVMCLSVVMKFVLPEGVPEHFAHLGWDLRTVLLLAILESACTLAYVVPRTAVLGAVLLTAYLGAAAAAHVRVGDGVAPFPVVLGVMVWSGLWLRDARVRALLPIRG